MLSYAKINNVHAKNSILTAYLLRTKQSTITYYLKLYQHNLYKNLYYNQ